MLTTTLYIIFSIGILAAVVVGYVCFQYLQRNIILKHRQEKKAMAATIEKQLQEQKQLEAKLLLNNNDEAQTKNNHIHLKLEQQWLLEKKQLESDIKELAIKYAFLCSQVNPHFLQNTFNFFYARALKANDPHLTEGIITLSAMMRYALPPTQEFNETVALQEELKHIDNIIKINQLRFNNKLQISYQKNVDEVSTIRIVPLVLITLVENALKHGELYDNNYPLQIQLTIHAKENQLEFLVLNKIKTGPKEQGHGIALDDIRWKLDAIYGQHYSLTTTADNNCFKAILILGSLIHSIPNRTPANNTLSNKDLPALLDKA